MNYPDYPFTGRYIEVRPGIRMHYLDEGPRDGEVVVMVHGNPSWSYYWRKLVLGLRDRYRCIVPDHVGMGLSDKPDDRHYRYTLQSRVDDLDTLLSNLNVDRPITLVVHDWGGIIGLGWSLRDMTMVRRLVILNTAAFPLPAAKKMPWQLAFGRSSRIAGLLIRGFNAFSGLASYVGVAKPMPKPVRKAYVAPYDSWAHRIATLRFVQDIPLSENDAAWPLLTELGRRLPEYANRPALIGWGMKDFIFDRHFLDGFRQALPQAQVHAYEDAGHYVLEDKADVLVSEIRNFLDAHPLP
ncbi:MAG: alpha/beta fold hydrolase [Xanthomonadaceae bacterium]|jgi:haloalkane dehalogenase|nr:alpha/beta fold hydrolase [Xanthomonadaceae bacterium]